MNILIVTHLFPPNYNAGTEIYTLGLAQSLIAKGHTIHVVCAEDWENGEKYWNGVTEDNFKGVNVHRVHLNWKKANNPNKILYYSILVEKWFDKFLQENKFDIVHVTSSMTLGIGVLRSVQRSGLPQILTLTDFWFVCPNAQLIRSDDGLCDGKTSAYQCERCLLFTSRIAQTMDKIPLSDPLRELVWDGLSNINILSKVRGLRGMLLNMNERKKMLLEALAIPDLVLAPSIFVQQMVTQIAPVHVSVFRHGHELGWTNKYKKNSHKQIHFTFIGQLIPTKGVHILVEAFKLANINEQACLDIWGDSSRNTPYVNRVKELINQDPSIELRGRFNHDQLSTVLAATDAVVVPSIWYENAPLVIQESFAVRIPVITTNLGGMAEAVTDEVNGLLFERGNPDDLAKKLRRIVDEPGLVDRLKDGILPIKTVVEETNELEDIYLALIHDRKLSKQQKL